MGKIKAFFRFLISKVFLLNLLAALLVVFLIGYFSLSYIESYANNDSENYKKYYIEIPNFKGVNVDDLDDFMADKDLKYVISDSVYSDDAPAGTVIRQNPDAFTEENQSYGKPGRTVYLTIVKKGGEYKEVPDLISNYHSMKLAKVKLEMLGFHPEFESVVNKNNYVIKLEHNGKELQPNTKLLKGSVIKVYYGSGEGGQPVMLPKVTGMKVSEAHQTLALAGLEVEVLYENAQTAEDSLDFVVYKQVPNPNSVVKGIVPSGSMVSVFARKYEPVSDSIPE